ncbi:recombinase RecT [Leptotrichia sp. oral taxon 218]|mgnify:CR=1 FL=1|jgi:recombinase, phage recT family|uniref:recombinase RecT n=1 Tax=Leptotrichia sp. oral taxon 218 TaxID=712361 RepID=UPI001B8C0AB0|nr:recombinase RecT [Leptotrichia sp. oral taxon 218]QUB95851.1 recombinase RecT [Leptotrichia sp. oral taxon 218]
MAGTLTNPRKSKRTVGTSTLKSMINDERTKNKFKELLGNKAAGFLTSLINTTNGNKQLQEAEPQSILKAGAIAATLDLPIDPNLGFSYIVPYNNKGRNEAQFQLGYKGFIQLAIRTGQYKKINVTELYEGQFESYDPITDELKYNLDGKISDEVTHYIAYFQTTNGFEKYNVMSKEEVREHAKKFSKTFLSRFSSWQTNFDSMAKKTVLKLLLSKFGILSIEMQTAQKVDQAVIREVESNGNVEVEYVDSPDGDNNDIKEVETIDSEEDTTENFDSEEIF